MAKPDFHMETYNRLLQAVLEKGYSFQTYRDFSRDPQQNVVIMRHDVDRKPGNALKMAEMEQRLGISACYYFRIVKESWNESIIKAIAALGHEIGYHYEDLALAGGNTEKAIAGFEQNLEKLRRLSPVTTMCMHGSPMSRWDNRSLWESYDYKGYGIIAEPYFDLDFNEILYITDASRSWDGGSFTVRDKVESNYDYRFKTTDDIVRSFDLSQMPARIMINVHPHNWSAALPEWFKVRITQALKNQVKRRLVRRGNK